MSDNKDATQPLTKLMPNMKFNQHFSNGVVAKAFEEAILAEIKREKEEFEAREAADRDMPTLVGADGDEFFGGDFVKLDLDDDKDLKEREEKVTKLEQQVKVGMEIIVGKQAELEKKDMALEKKKAALVKKELALEATEKQIKAREKFVVEKGIALQEQKIALEEKYKDLQAREKIWTEMGKTFEKENRMLNVRLEALDCKEDAVIKKLDY